MLFNWNGIPRYKDIYHVMIQFVEGNNWPYPMEGFEVHTRHEAESIAKETKDWFSNSDVRVAIAHQVRLGEIET